jgi:hypothetical protein
VVRPSLLIIFFLFPVLTCAAERMCDKFDFLDCPDVFSGNRSGGASVPGQGPSLSTVPASIADIDRTGIELIKYEGSYDVNLVAGTGVIGFGFSTTNNEGAFFGNIPIESDQEYWIRKTNTDRYKSQKVSWPLISLARKREANP